MFEQKGGGSEKVLERTGEKKRADPTNATNNDEPLSAMFCYCLLEVIKRDEEEEEKEEEEEEEARTRTSQKEKKE